MSDRPVTRVFRDLYPHQLQMFRVLKAAHANDLPGVILLTKVGGGKTASTLYFLKFKQQSFTKTLIVAPKNVAETVWNQEIQEWDELNRMRAIVLAGKTPNKRLELLDKPADFYTINYELLSWLNDNYDINRFNCIVYDEISMLKSHSSKVSVLAMKLANSSNAFKIGLTGTPAGNNIAGLWSETSAITGKENNPLGRNITTFRREYFYSFGNEFWQIKPRDNALDQMLQVLWDSDIACSFKVKNEQKMDYISIPIKLPLTVSQQYKKLAKEYFLWLDKHQNNLVDVANAATLSSKLRQMESGAIYYENIGQCQRDEPDQEAETNPLARAKKEYEVLHEVKLRKLQDLLIALNGESLLIFYEFIHEKERISTLCEKMKLSFATKITPEVIQNWNARKLDVLILHPKSAGHGLNLQYGGNNVLFFSVPWSLELWVQANGRLPRPGQVKTVNVFTFSGLQVETRVIERLKELKEIDQRFFDDLAVQTAPQAFARSSKRGTRVKSNGTGAGSKNCITID